VAKPSSCAVLLDDQAGIGCSIEGKWEEWQHKVKHNNAPIQGRRVVQIGEQAAGAHSRMVKMHDRKAGKGQGGRGGQGGQGQSPRPPQQPAKAPKAPKAPPTAKAPTEIIVGDFITVRDLATPDGAQPD
jgi:hypothetical protein